MRGTVRAGDSGTVQWGFTGLPAEVLRVSAGPIGGRFLVLRVTIRGANGEPLGFDTVSVPEHEFRL